MNDTKTDLERTVKGQAETLETLVRVITEQDDGTVYPDIFAVLADGGYDDVDRSDVASTAETMLDESILEAYQVGRARFQFNDWEMTSVVVVFGTGGPHIELDTSEGAVMGYWASDRARYGVTSVVVDYFEQMAGE